MVPRYAHSSHFSGLLFDIILVAWNLGCGFAQNKEQLIAFRFLSGLGGSAPLSVSGAYPVSLYFRVVNRGHTRLVEAFWGTAGRRKSEAKLLPCTHSHHYWDLSWGHWLGHGLPRNRHGVGS